MHLALTQGGLLTQTHCRFCVNTAYAFESSEYIMYVIRSQLSQDAASGVIPMLPMGKAEVERPMS